MRFKHNALLVLVLCGVISAELQGPPPDEQGKTAEKTTTQQQQQQPTVAGSSQDSIKNERKASEVKEEVTATFEDTTIELKDDEGGIDIDIESLNAILPDDFSFQGSSIKIVKAPDLHKEKEMQKVSEMLTTLVDSHAKLIKKFEDEIEEMDDSIAALNHDEEPPHIPTAEEIEAENLYENAMKVLNKTRSDKSGAFGLLQQAAAKGHEQAQAKIAWAQLVGHPIDMNFEAAKETFLKLAERGVPEAHMVSFW